MDNMNLEQITEKIDQILHPEEEVAASLSVEDMRQQNEFIDSLDMLKVEDRIAIGDENLYRLTSIKNRNLTRILLGDEKTGGDSSEMMAIKDSMAVVEEKINGQGTPTDDVIETTTAAYQIAIANCKHYIETKNPRFAAGQRRKQMVEDALAHLQKEKEQLELGAKLMREGHTEGMTINSMQDLLVVAMIHDSKFSDPIEDIKPAELSKAMTLTIEDFQKIIADGSGDSSDMVEFKDGKLQYYERQGIGLSILWAENKSTIYNRQMKERLVEVLKEQLGKETNETKKFLIEFRKKINLTGARTSDGISKLDLIDALRTGGVIASSVEKTFVANETAREKHDDSLAASTEDTAVANAVVSVLNRAVVRKVERKIKETDDKDKNKQLKEERDERIRIANRETDAYAAQVKDIFKKAKAAGLPLEVPKGDRLKTLCTGNIAFVQDQIFKAIKQIYTNVKNMAGMDNFDIDTLTGNADLVNVLSALVITRYTAATPELRSVWDDKLQDLIRVHTLQFAGQATSENITKLDNGMLRSGSDGLDALIERRLPSVDEWKSNMDSLRKGTSLLKSVCDSSKEIQDLMREGMESGLTAEQKNRLRAAGANMQSILSNEQSRGYIDFVVQQIADSKYAKGYEEAVGLLTNDFSYEHQVGVIADSFKETTKQKKAEEKPSEDFEEKLSKLSAESKKFFDVLGIHRFSTLMGEGEDAGAVKHELKKMRDTLRCFQSNRAIIRTISVAGATFKIAQRTDNTLYFVSDGQVFKLNETAEQLASHIEGDMVAHTDIYGDDMVREMFWDLDFSKENTSTYVNSRNMAIKYLSGKLGVNDVFFANVASDLLRGWCFEYLHGRDSSEQIKACVTAIDSTVHINGKEVLDLLQRLDNTEEARQQRQREAEEARQRQIEEARRVAAEKAVNAVADAAVAVTTTVTNSVSKAWGSIKSFFRWGSSQPEQAQTQQAQPQQAQVSEQTQTQQTQTQQAQPQQAQTQQTDTRRVHLTKAAMGIGALKQAVGFVVHGKSLDDIVVEVKDKTMSLVADMFFTQDTWITDEHAQKPGKAMQTLIRKNYKVIEFLALREQTVYDAIDQMGKKEDGSASDDPLITTMKSGIKEMLNLLINMKDLKTAIDDDSEESLAKFAELESKVVSVVNVASDVLQNKIEQDTRNMFRGGGTTNTEIERLKAQIRSIQESSDLNETQKKKAITEIEKKILDKTVEQATSGETGQGLFFKNILSNYFKSVSDIDKRSMLASAFRAQAEGKSALGGYIKGAGPLLQKLLQGMPVAGMSADLKEALEDVKSNLADIPEKVVKAQFNDIIARSKGRITEIKIDKPLGAASVGQAFLCILHGPEFGEKGKEVVIKVLRPEVRNRMMREKQVLLWCARKTDSANEGDFDPTKDYTAMTDDVKAMQATYLGSLKRIEEELDLSIEARNAEAGSVYDRGYSTVKSMKVDTVVDATTNTLVLEKAEGVTVDKFRKELDKKIKELAASVFKRNENGEWVVNGVVHMTPENSARFKKKIEELYRMLADAKQKHAYLAQISEQWVTEGIYGAGFYHGDLHAGNMMVSDKGATIIDYGNATTLSEEQREEIVRMMTAASYGNGEVFLEGFHKLLENTPEEKYQANEAKLLQAFNEILNLGDESCAGQRIMACLLKAQEIGIEVPPSIYNFSMSQMRLQNTLDESIGQIKDIAVLIGKFKQFTFSLELEDGDVVEQVSGLNLGELKDVRISLNIRDNHPEESFADSISRQGNRALDTFKEYYGEAYSHFDDFKAMLANGPLFRDKFNVTLTESNRERKQSELGKITKFIKTNLTGMKPILSDETYNAISAKIEGWTIETCLTEADAITALIDAEITEETHPLYRIYKAGKSYDADTEKDAQKLANIKDMVRVYEEEHPFTHKYFVDFRNRIKTPEKLSHITEVINELTNDEQIDSAVRTKLREKFGAVNTALNKHRADIDGVIDAFFEEYKKVMFVKLDALIKSREDAEQVEAQVSGTQDSSFNDIMGSIIESNLISTAKMLGAKTIWQFRKDLLGMPF